MVPTRRTLVLALSTAFAGCGSISSDGGSPTDARSGASRSPTRTPSGRSTDTHSPSPVDSPEGTRDTPNATDTPSPAPPDGPCEVGVPSITDTFVETLETGGSPATLEDWTRRTGIQLPTISVDSFRDSPGILVFGSITGADGCAYPTLVGTDYSDRRSELTIDMGIERRGEMCDDGITTRIYRAWLSLAEPTFPQQIRLRQADYDETRTYAVGPIDCR